MTITDEFINSKVFFNDGVSDERRDKVKQIIKSVGATFEQKFPEEFFKIVNDIEFVICKEKEGDRSPLGGLTTNTYNIDKPNNHFYVIFCPNYSSETRDDIFILAHEFAHVLYGHPAEADKSPRKKKEREIEASKKASEWGFDPSEYMKSRDPFFVSLQRDSSN